MVILTERENSYMQRLKFLIAKRGFKNLVQTEFEAGFISQAEMNNVFQYLKETNWSLADKLIAEDAKLIRESEKIFMQEPRKRREKTKIDPTLNRKLRNLFTRDEFARLKIKEMSYDEAQKLLEKREKELMSHVRK